MSTMSPMPKDHPIMVGWEKYKSTEEFSNSKFWASKPEHVEGSLWAAYLQGQQDAIQSQQKQLLELSASNKKLRLALARSSRCECEWSCHNEQGEIMWGGQRLIRKCEDCKAKDEALSTTRCA